VTWRGNAAQRQRNYLINLQLFHLLFRLVVLPLLGALNGASPVILYPALFGVVVASAQNLPNPAISWFWKVTPLSGGLADLLIMVSTR